MYDHQTGQRQLPIELIMSKPVSTWLNTKTKAVHSGLKVTF